MTIFPRVAEPHGESSSGLFERLPNVNNRVFFAPRRLSRQRYPSQVMFETSDIDHVRIYLICTIRWWECLALMLREPRVSDVSGKHSETDNFWTFHNCETRFNDCIKLNPGDSKVDEDLPALNDGKNNNEPERKDIEMKDVEIVDSSRKRSHEEAGVGEEQPPAKRRRTEPELSNRDLAKNPRKKSNKKDDVGGGKKKKKKSEKPSDENVSKKKKKKSKKSNDQEDSSKKKKKKKKKNQDVVENPSEEKETGQESQADDAKLAREKVMGGKGLSGRKRSRRESEEGGDNQLKMNEPWKKRTRIMTDPRNFIDLTTNWVVPDQTTEGENVPLTIDAEGDYKQKFWNKHTPKVFNQENLFNDHGQLINRGFQDWYRQSPSSEIGVVSIHVLKIDDLDAFTDHSWKMLKDTMQSFLKEDQRPDALMKKSFFFVSLIHVEIGEGSIQLQNPTIQRQVGEGLRNEQSSRLVYSFVHALHVSSTKPTSKKLHQVCFNWHYKFSFEIFCLDCVDYFPRFSEESCRFTWNENSRTSCETSFG